MITRESIRYAQEWNKAVIAMNTSGITHGESVDAAPPEGNSLDWVLGHILATRNSVHQLLGLPPAVDEAHNERYTRGTQRPDAAEARPVDELVAELATSADAIVSALEGVSAERLAQPFAEGKDTPLSERLLFYQLHETYHVGQLGTLRRMAGKTGAIP